MDDREFLAESLGVAVDDLESVLESIGVQDVGESIKDAAFDEFLDETGLSGFDESGDFY
jgi:hypothetical protein